MNRRPVKSLPKVILLGDSIRGSYQAPVAEKLKERAEVVAPAENCAFSLYTLTRLDTWIGQLGKPDVVHWNNGLHDVGHNPNRGPVQIPCEDFQANVEFILKRLRELTPHVIWATMTPVHPKRPFNNEGWSWRNEEIDRYNKAALEVMAKHAVPVNDLHALVYPHRDRFIVDDGVHLSPAGIEACAEAVVRAIIPRLPARS